MIQTIKKLSDMRAISGFEYRINREIAQMLGEYADEVKIDALGNVIAKKSCGNTGAPSIMIEAHMDEIGLIVTSVDEKGYLTFANVGGVDNRILPSLEVVVHGKEDIWGVIGVKPAYLREEGKTAPVKDLAIDTGLCADKVKELVSVGDSVTIAQSVGKIGAGQWSGKTLDDRAGVAALILALKALGDTKLNIDVYAVAAVQEEVGCRGAKTAAYGVNPDMAIAVDVTHAVTPDNSTGAFEGGSGAIIAKGPNLHPAMVKRLVKTAKMYGIKTDIEIEGGDTGTDAWEIQTAKDGIATALISIPLKYMHTSVETLVLEDVQSTADLIEKFIADMEGNIKWLYN
ncbi:MAG: M20/M25/M40 family metallo-hydrolase [Clostridiales bacterium]|nr:M20/M25/M40 family metallo-hydrolase [Clostridiales bacterium]